MINEVLTKKNINFGEVQEDFLTYLDVEKVLVRLTSVELLIF